MKKSLSTLVLLFVGASSFAQQDIYALTGKTTESIVFQDFRGIDSKNGLSTKTYFSDSDIPNVTSINQNTAIAENKKAYNNSQAVQMATLAIDSRGNLIYMPLFSSNIYILDTKTKAISLLENSVSNPKPCDLSSQFSRMATGKDGNVYALSNSGSQLLKISYNNGKYSVEDLGVVKDDSGNAENLLTKMEIGFGGDMVADNDNNLFVFSASGNVFKLNINEMKAKFVGKIKGLPDMFSVNGVAVNSAGNVVLASARGGVLQTLNMETLFAEAMKSNLQLPIYDLASSYFLKGINQGISITKNDIYPTKVTENYVNVSLVNSQTGNAIVKVYNATGTMVLNRTISNVNNSENKIDLGNLPAGMYVVNVSQENGKQITSKKILVK